MHFFNFFNLGISLALTCCLATVTLKGLETQSAKTATCLLSPTKGNQAKGKVTFTAEKDGVKIVADVYNLKPGAHGFHIHEKGDCSAPDASSAGDHFNPTGVHHGGPDDQERHAGDLGNIIADETGHAHYERLDKLISLEGVNSVVGRSVVIHEKADDFKTQPTGNSGGRIACGLIK